MRYSHEIVTRVEANSIDELMNATHPAIPTLPEVLESLKTLALIVALNPAFQANALAQAETDNAAAIIKALQPVEG